MKRLAGGLGGVARIRHGLPVRLIPKEDGIATMGSDVVNLFGEAVAATDTEGMRSQEGGSSSAPAAAIEPTSGVEPGMVLSLLTVVRGAMPASDKAWTA